MKRSISYIRELPEFKSLVANINAGEAIPNLGLGRSTRLPILAALHIELSRPILLLTYRTNQALTLVDELELWLSNSDPLYFPEPTSMFYENMAWGENTRRDRLLALSRLMPDKLPDFPSDKEAPIIVAPARAVMARTIPKREFLDAKFSLYPGVNIDPGQLAAKLIINSYSPSNTVTSPGQFARRGGILDLWPPAEEYPTRLEFFGDDIDSLRTFDPATQLSTNSQTNLTVSPAREYLINNEIIEVDIGEELSEFHIPLLGTNPASLIDLLPEDTLIIADDWQTIRESMEEIEEQAINYREDQIRDSAIPKDYPIPYLTYSEILDSAEKYQKLELGPVADPQASEIANKFSIGQRFGGQLKPLMEHIQKLYDNGDNITIVSRQAARLKELWDVSVFDQFSESPPMFIEGSLSEGWILETVSGVLHCLLTDGEVFGWRRPQLRQRPRIALESPESYYSDFKINEFVVHIDHGIGRFKGLVDRSVEGTEHEYLCVEYAEGDQLYVPVHQADRLTRYVGTNRTTASINRLGGIEWHRAKSKVQAAVQEIADDLLDLYAKRRLSKGHAFSADTAWQGELESSFPYIETEDQIRVIAEVKRDMEKAKPMDRLICGDVGYGKTEIALRAAFKAVMDGKQVALLVPTTILAQQHLHTFRQRLAAFPVEVEMLSRFRTPSQQKNILAQLQDGSLDIIIGTHRLVQADVLFKDLGLVIIDEEQRFGVGHKEHLKQLREQIDVLTMTATPIPRTLYLSLAGVRDISTINTPPEERLPIVTHVGGYSPQQVRQAILRELERGGQVFFVHNRVHSIMAMRNRLSRQIPQARIEIAHGQMGENELAKRMQDFTRGDIDVLVTTSIIESGLDIPNANTLIVDRADTFGLAQLYQLRGRVGRGAQRAYAYFFRHRHKSPTDEGRLRLETLAENTQLGAGYSIAMRDLEIRGAGDILGTRQHGQIAAVGFHLYTRLLNQAVDQIRKQGKLGSDSILASASLYHPIISIDLPISVNIPKYYVPEKNLRISLYRRIAELGTLAEVEALKVEFADRFGPLPDSVINLIFQLKVKLLAEKVGLVSISPENNQLALRFPSLPNGASPRQYPRLEENIRTSKNTIWMPIGDNSSWRQRLIDVLLILAKAI